MDGHYCCRASWIFSRTCCSEDRVLLCVCVTTCSNIFSRNVRVCVCIFFICVCVCIYLYYKRHFVRVIWSLVKHTYTHKHIYSNACTHTYIYAHNIPPSKPCNLSVCVSVCVSIFMQIWLVGQTSRLQAMSPACVSLYMCMFGGVMVGAPQHFVMAHLTKQRQLTFLVLCHVPYSVTSQDCGCKDPITPPLSISLLGVVVVVMKCLGWGLGGCRPFTPDRPCYSNAKPHLLQIHPPLFPSLPPPFYYFVGFHSYFWMG